MKNLKTTKRLKSIGCQIRSLVAQSSLSAFVMFVLAILAAFVIWLWVCDGWNPLTQWMRAGAIKPDSNGTVLRNLVWAIGVPVGILLAVWRSLIAQDQVKASHKQAETAQNQAQTAERGLLNERYQKGADMLGSETMATRFGGIMALGRLAQGHPENYHIQVMNLLCAFARHPAHVKNGETDTVRRCRPDVEQAVQTIGRRSEAQIELEKKEGWSADLTGTNLTEANLRAANLTGMDMSGAEMSGAEMTGAEMTGADLTGADLTGADLTGADLTGADLTETDVTGADMTAVTGLSQFYLDLARVEEGGKPPDVLNAFCADSGEPLAWTE